jgi:hypothetical protein
MVNSNLISAKDILAKWDRVTGVEAEAIKSVENLSAQIATTYKLPLMQAHAEVKAWVAGRTF